MMNWSFRRYVSIENTSKISDFLANESQKKETIQVYISDYYFANIVTLF